MENSGSVVAGSKNKFRQDINALRAWAVVSVVLYHFGVPGFSGGFVGIGSRFWFRVATEPQANFQKPVGTPVKPVGSGALAGRILVAEDNPVNRLVAKALLESQGLQADFVEDGRAAVDAATGGVAYDLILMDIQMPVMDGQQATRCIREWETQHGAKRSAIVALTAGAFEDDKQRCAEAGMDDFLAKPIELPSLIAQLSRWLAS